MNEDPIDTKRNSQEDDKDGTVIVQHGDDDMLLRNKFGNDNVDNVSDWPNHHTEERYLYSYISPQQVSLDCAVATAF